MAERKETKRLLKVLGITDTRAEVRRLIEYRNRRAKAQSRRAQSASLEALKELFT
jgi:hypothetical protein